MQTITLSSAAISRYRQIHSFSHLFLVALARIIQKREHIGLADTNVFPQYLKASTRPRSEHMAQARAIATNRRPLLHAIGLK